MWLSLLLVFIFVPALLGVSLGVHRLYMRMLLEIFEVVVVWIITGIFAVATHQATVL